MTRLCGQRILCAKPRAHEGDCATEGELAAAAVVASVRAFLAADTRHVDEMNPDAYRAWRAMVDAAQDLRRTEDAQATPDVRLGCLEALARVAERVSLTTVRTEGTHWLVDRSHIHDLDVALVRCSAKATAPKGERT